MAKSWLALVIGNTRLHWGYFYQKRFLGAWHTPPLTESIATQLQQAYFQAEGWRSVMVWAGNYTPSQLAALPTEPLMPADIWVASAVPAQSALWSIPARMAQRVVRSRIPLSGLYPTLGIDRAINLLGAGELEGWPILVIDMGTAITLTAGLEGAIYGGAILPGLRLQHEGLAQKTAALHRFMPSLALAQEELNHLPNRWAVDTEEAISSGLIYGITATVIDYLQDWWQRFPSGKAIITGGDGPYFYQCLQQRTPEIASRVLMNTELMFYGMCAYRKAVMP